MRDNLLKKYKHLASSEIFGCHIDCTKSMEDIMNSSLVHDRGMGIKEPNRDENCSCSIGNAPDSH